MLQQVRQRANLRGGNDRDTPRGGFGGYEAKRFEQAGDHQNVACGVKRVGILDRAQAAVMTRQFWRHITFAELTAQQQHDIRMTLESLDQSAIAFTLLNSSQVTDDGTAVIMPDQRTACSRTLLIAWNIAWRRRV